MLRIKFEDQKKFTSITDFVKNKEKIIIVGKNIPDSKTGFVAYRSSGQLLGEYLDWRITANDGTIAELHRLVQQSLDPLP